MKAGIHFFSRDRKPRSGLCAFETLSLGILNISINKLKSQMKCCSCLQDGTCGREDFNCLSLELPNKIKSTIDDCIKLFLGEELIPLKENWRCGKCGAVSAGKKQLFIELFPDLLILHLKRFKYSDHRRTKDYREVDIPAAVSVDEINYNLIAVVEHSGSFDSGHYTALVRMENRWFRCNDTEVREVSFSESFGSRGYLAFFRQE